MARTAELPLLELVAAVAFYWALMVAGSWLLAQVPDPTFEKLGTTYDDAFGIMTVALELAAVLLAVWIAGRRPVVGVFRGGRKTDWVAPIIALAAALPLITLLIGGYMVLARGASAIEF